jgi:DNA-binding transcriptional MerR regulator
MTDFFNMTVNLRNEISATSAAHRDIEDNMKFINACQGAAAARETGLPNGKLRARYEAAGLAKSPSATLANDGCKMRARYKDAVTPEDFMACLKRDKVETIRGLREFLKTEDTPAQEDEKLATKKEDLIEQLRQVNERIGELSETRQQRIASKVEAKQAKRAEKLAEKEEAK